MQKRQSYCLDQLDEAVSAVKRSHLTVSKASMDYGIPRKTIEDHVKGRYSNHRHGPRAMLDETEENALVSYMKYLVQQGVPMSRAMVRQYILSMTKSSGKRSLFNTEIGASDKWFRKFFKRHSELTERVAERQDRSRARMANETVINSFFDLLEYEVKRLGLEEEPGRIFNCDETGWNGKEKSRQKVIGVKGYHSYQQALSSSGHITAHLCISGDGRILPTLIIFEKSLPHTSYKAGVPSNWMFGYSDSGYMDTHLFYVWFRDVFIPNCGRKRPVLLVMDNHDSHINLEIVKLARENGVELLGLPPHTTHILQPLDVGINGPLKAKFSSIAVNLGHVNKHQILNKARFPVVLSFAIDQFCSPAKIKEAFRKSGLSPVDRNAIDKTQVAASQFPNCSSSFSDPIRSSSEPSTSAAVPCPPTSEKSGSSTCASCGSFLGGNPLVLEGLIPESLADIFPPVPAKPQTARRKVITEARVITSDKFFEQLENRVNEDEKRKEEIARRKQEREERWKQKEQKEKEKKAKGGKAKGRPIQQRHSEMEKENDDVVDDDVCCYCHKFELTSGDDDGNVLWVGCDQCGDWYHQECLGMGDQDMDDVYFVCVNCCEGSRHKDHNAV